MTPPSTNPSTVDTPVKMKVPGWVKWWLGLLTAVLILVAVVSVICAYSFWTYKKDMYAWNKQMHRWAAHYYYCDSVHKDPAKCAQWSDHIPPPPPPPT
jgi:hypothetical protein